MLVGLIALVVDIRLLIGRRPRLNARGGSVVVIVAIFIAVAVLVVGLVTSGHVSMGGRREASGRAMASVQVLLLAIVVGSEDALSVVFATAGRESGVGGGEAIASLASHHVGRVRAVVVLA